MTKTKLTRQQIRSYIEQNLFQPSETNSGSQKINNTGCIGIELECFPYIKSNNPNHVKPAALWGGKQSLANTLVKISQQHGGIAKTRKHQQLKTFDSTLIDKIEFPNGDCFLFEPGGQLEIRTKKCNSIIDLQHRMEHCQQLLNETEKLSAFGFAQLGTNPLKNAGQLGNQINKDRYRALKNYFDLIGPYGKQMMLQTCGMHINLDLGMDENTRVKRIVAANLLVPFVTALFANSPKIDGGFTAYKSYRSFIWQNADNSRTGILSPTHNIKQLKISQLIDSYEQFILNAPLIYISDLGDKVLPRKFTFAYWLQNKIEGIEPEMRHFENHISLLFPEVRIRGYLELRTVDAPPVKWQLVPVCFYSGIIYNDKSLNKTLELLSPFVSEINTLNIKAGKGLIDDRIFNTAKKLMNVAIEGFTALPEGFSKPEHLKLLIDFTEKYTKKRKCFADDFSDLSE